MTYVGLVWSYNGQVVSAYLDLYRFLKFALRRTRDVIILTDVRALMITSTQLRILHQIYHLPLECQNYLDYYQRYIRYPSNHSELMNILGQLTNVELCYFSGHNSSIGYQVPMGVLPHDFIYRLPWRKLVLIVDCCHPPDYQLPHRWTNQYQFDRTRWLATLHNLKLHQRHLIVACSPLGQYQVGDLYGSVMTRTILTMLDHSTQFMGDKQRYYPTYLLASNRIVTDTDWPRLTT